MSQNRRIGLKKLPSKSKKKESEDLSYQFESFISLSTSSQNKTKDSFSTSLEIPDPSESDGLNEETDSFTFPEKNLNKPNSSGTVDKDILSQRSESLSGIKIKCLDLNVQIDGSTGNVDSPKQGWPGLEKQDLLNDSSFLFQKNSSFLPKKQKCSLEALKFEETYDSTSPNVDNNSSFDDVNIPDVPKTGAKSGNACEVESVNEPKEGNEVNKQCPICFKTVSKYVSHMKSCAAKNKLNTQQLLSILKLHKRQLAERKELGLGIPIQSYRARVSPKRSRGNDKKGPVDANLQLALALSASLRSAEECELLEEAEALKEAGFSEEAHLRLSTLEQFVVPSAPGPQQRLLQGSSKPKLTAHPLLRRSREERERIVTEKVAIVLISEEGNTCLDQFEPKVPTLKSKRLKQTWDKESQLWTKAHCEEDERKTFYVEALSEFVTPSKAEVGDGLRRLSQLPGRLNTPEQPSTPELVTPLRVKSTSRTLEEASTIRRQLTNSENKTNKLSKDWQSLVGCQEMSDVKVQCKDGEVIPAHKIVFYVRCPSILNHIVEQQQVRESVLILNECSKSAAKAFLDFVYSGSLSQFLTLSTEDFRFVCGLIDRFSYSELKSRLSTLKTSCQDQNEKISQNLFLAKCDENYELCGVERLSPCKSSSNQNPVQSICETSLINNSKSISGSPQFHNVDLQNTEDSSDGRQSPDMFGESLWRNDSVSPEDRNDLDILASLVGKTTAQIEMVANGSYTNKCSANQNSSKDSPSIGTVDERTGKRKVLSFSEDEETSFSKKLCSDVSKNSHSENINKEDVCDLTQSSDSSLENLKLTSCENSNQFCVEKSFGDEIVWMDENDEFENEVNNTMAELTQKQSFLPSSPCNTSEASKTPEIQNSSRCHDFIDPVWDGFEPDDNYLHYNYTPNSHSQHSNNSKNSPKGLNSSPNTLPFTLSQNSHHLTPKTSPEVRSISSDSKSPRKLSQTTINEYLQKSSTSSEKKSNNQSYDLHCSDLEIEIIEQNHSQPLPQKLKQNLNSQFDPFNGTSQKSSNGSNLQYNSPVKSLSQLSPKQKYGDLKDTSHKKDSLTVMQRLLDDSFEINDSILASADALAVKKSGNNDEETAASSASLSSKHLLTESVDPNHLQQSKAALTTPSPQMIVSDNITPLPDYSAMKTPSLKRELSKFGLKPSLGKRKAKLLLRYIYDQTHPFVPDPGGVSEQQSVEFKEPAGEPARSPRKSPTKPQTNVNLVDSESEEELCSQRSSSSVSSTVTVPEESFCEFDDILTQEASAAGDIRASIRHLIVSNAELHRKVLMYEPILLEDFIKTLRANGIKSKTKDVMNYLDEQCITFRTNSWKSVNQKRKQKNIKKKEKDDSKLGEMHKKSNKAAAEVKSPSKSQPNPVKKRGRPRKLLPEQGPDTT